jgi:hypothetical protein
MMNSKRAALELSVSTIVVIVLGVTMLIIGMVLVRNIMCGALGLTGDINGKVQSQINELFGSSEGEIQCIGAGGDPVQLIPGKLNVIWCGVHADKAADYKIETTEIKIEGVSQTELAKWKESDKWTGTVSPGDTAPKKVVRLNIPDDAPESSVIVRLSVSRDGRVITTQDLDFEIKRAGLVRASVC